MQQDKLDFAYKYPFSQEAKEVVAELKVNSIEKQYLQEGVLQLSGALKEGRIAREKIRGLAEIKRKYIMGYVYARMLVSAVGDGYSISKFAAAEAEAASDHLALSIDEMLKIANEVGLQIGRDRNDFKIRFENFVSVPKKSGDMRLINQRLVDGMVYINERQLLDLVKSAIEKAISSSLPIDKKNLPKEIVEAAKGLKPQEKRIAIGVNSGTYAWIEKLLANPIADVRHRSVNLIFAPYLVNVKKLDEESAARVIMDYIEKCKVINPNTKINEKYIRYQCKYAKTKGLRPLSMQRARELLKEIAEFG